MVSSVVTWCYFLLIIFFLSEKREYQADLEVKGLTMTDPVGTGSLLLNSYINSQPKKQVHMYAHNRIRKS